MGENRRNFSGSFGGVLRIRLLKLIKFYIDFTAVGTESVELREERQDILMVVAERNSAENA